MPNTVLSDPALDSQNRFYGVSFMLYGVLLYLAATDLKRYAPVLYALLWIFLAGGLARLVTIALYGFPPPLIAGLLAAEIVIPPILLAWTWHTQKNL